MLIYFYVFVFGLAIGSFLNVLIDRLPKGQSIMGRSHCDNCRHKLNGADLFPVLSFIFLRGKCRYCGKKISWQYPLIELLTGISYVLIVNFQFPLLRQGFGVQAILNQFSIFNFEFLIQLARFISYLGLFSTLIVIFFADVKYQIIPDSMQISFFVFTFLLHIINLGFDWKLIIGNWNFLLAGILVMLPILILYWLTKGRGMGFGDVKLAFVIGFFLGFKAGFLALYCGFILGAIIGLILIIFKQKKLKSKIAFGPFLVLGMIIVLVWQRPIYDLIYRIYGL